MKTFAGGGMDSLKYLFETNPSLPELANDVRLGPHSGKAIQDHLYWYELY